MTSKSHSPRALDVAAFAGAGGQLGGEWPAAQMERLLAGSLPLEAWAAPAVVHFHARGELKPRPGARPEVWMHLSADCVAAMTCQRCLQAMKVPLQVNRAYLFVATEALAAELDDELEDDVLVLSRALDLAELVEDELILALPLVPRHADCRLPGENADRGGPPPPPANPAATPCADHPFAVLAQLKRPK